MKVFLSVASFKSNYGGPARSVSCLAMALADAGLTVGVWAPDQSAGASEFLDRDCGVLRLSGNESEAIEQLGKVDLIHDNGIWLPYNHRLARLAIKRSIPRVVSIRGMLEPWALNHKRWKKRLAWHLYQFRDISAAAVLHATAESEAHQIKKLGLTNPIHVVQNGVNLPTGVRSTKSEPKTALFLGRLHPKKGLPLLVDAWERVMPPGWNMRVVGPDEGGHRAVVEALVKRAGLTDKWSFESSLEGVSKRQAFEQASLFILPTHSENFGIAVAEALAHGIPVITTHGAPWSGLEVEDCGWWTPVTVDQISAALADATNRPSVGLQMMGQRGRLWMQRDFSWSSVASGMLNLYECVLK